MAKKVKTLEAQLSGSIEENVAMATEGKVTDQFSDGPQTSIVRNLAPWFSLLCLLVIHAGVMLQLGILEMSKEGASDADGRENLIKQHYMKRISELTMKLQMADSKALHFHAEVLIPCTFCRILIGCMKSTS